MARKKTSAAVAKIAGDILATDNPLEAHKDAIGEAIRGCGLPLGDRAVSAVVDRIGDALAPFIADVRSLAASALSQDEEPSKPVEPPLSEADEEARREHFFNPDGDGEP